MCRVPCPICNKWNVIVEELPCVSIGHCNDCGGKWEDEKVVKTKNSEVAVNEA